MSEVLGGHTECEPIQNAELLAGKTPYPIDEAQWYRQFGTDRAYEANKTFFIVQRKETLDCSLFDGDTGEYLGWLARY